MSGQGQVMTATHRFGDGDFVGKLKALGFINRTDGPDWRYDLQLDDVRVTASVSFDAVFLAASHSTPRSIGQVEVRVPICAPLGAYAEGLMQIMRKIHPEIINWDADWADIEVTFLRIKRPQVWIHRPLLRRELKVLKGRVKQIPLPDARLDYFDNSKVGTTGQLRITIADTWTILPAAGVWVGRIWVKSRELLKALDQRFRHDPVNISLDDNLTRRGKWLWVGNRAMRASWEEPIEPAATAPAT
jgi:hypothetical protein